MRETFRRDGLKRFLPVVFILLLITGCVEPTYTVVGTNVHCREFCPARQDMKIALTSQKAMWDAAGYDWPEATIHFLQRDWLGAKGSSGHDSIMVWKRGHEVWESTIDHEMGMLVFDPANGRESEAINKRRQLGICYENGDTGYCNE